jgi:hypothetical protein
MTGGSAPRFGELIDLRIRLANENSANLKVRYPLLSYEIERGERLGEETGLSSAYLKQVALFSADTLDDLTPYSEKAVGECQKRLRYEGCLRLGAHIVSIIGASSILTLLSLAETKIAIITTAITLSASGIIAVADFLGKISGDGQKNLNVQELYDRLTSARLGAKLLSNELRVMSQYYSDGMNIQEKINQANALAYEINKSGGLIMLRTQ